MAWKQVAGAIGIGIGLAVALDNPDSTNDKVDSGGSIFANVMEEVGNVANTGMGELQTVGDAPAADPSATTTTAPPAGSGRP